MIQLLSVFQLNHVNQSLMQSYAF